MKFFLFMFKYICDVIYEMVDTLSPKNYFLADDIAFDRRRFSKNFSIKSLPIA